MEEPFIGAHRLWFEPPDLMVMMLRGDISPDEMRGLTRRVREFPDDLLALVDVGELGQIPPESRKTVLALDRWVPYRAMAVVRASFQAKLAMQLMLGAMRITSRGRMGPTRLFAEEAEARAWLDSMRRDPG
ncbi:MAG TPA: STAS/SEC14 domain-containing protein [Candidatus Nanopelagicales bacterium]|nr:STAS/SEC14 domain-containing protein [Candidatus Nanopelagicales bacterium]